MNNKENKWPVLEKIDTTWTLFLDRDGVINHEKENDYVRKKGEFRFIDGVLEAMPVFARKFNRIIIVTNQKGIGKGLMSESDLRDIHLFMLDRITKTGGRVDMIYYCPDLDDNSFNRKPNPGMGLQAAKDFPDIDLQKSIMVGNTLGDMQFGKTLGACTVFIPSTKPAPELPHPLVDSVAEGLLGLAKAL